MLAGLKQQGLAGNVGALEDFGVQAEMKDDKIVVKQTKIEWGTTSDINLQAYVYIGSYCHTWW